MGLHHFPSGAVAGLISYQLFKPDHALYFLTRNRQGRITRLGVHYPGYFC